MESDRTLDNALAALEDISDNDLEEMLQIDSIMATQSADIMTKNREELSSQFSEGDRNLCDLMTSFDETSENAVETSSVLLATNEIETIEINDSLEIHFNRDEYDQSLSFSQNNFDNINQGELTFSQNSVEASDCNELQTSFDKEFEQLDDIDFEIPIFEEDNTTTMEVDNELQNTQLEKPMEFKSNKKFQIKSYSQLLPKSNDSSNDQNITKSCPNFTKPRLHSSKISSQKDLDQHNTMDYLEISYSATSSSEANKENTIEDTETIESPQSSVHTSQIHTPETTIDNNEIITAKPNDKSDTRKDINNTTTDATAIPSTVKQLYDIMKEQYSDFSFVYALSAQICQDRIPMGCFVNVKMSLLLSIASIGKNSDIAPIPIIVMGNDPYMANYLITSIADLADRFVGPVDDTKPPSSDGFCNRIWIEADPIQLAKGGVFYVGEWTCMKTQRSEKIFKDIETSRIAVERTSRIYPLQTAIWAHWRAMKYNSKDQQIFNKFVKIFGIPVYMDSSNYETLADYILKQASVQMFESTIDHLSISSDDMRKFLAIVSARTVDFTPEAIDLLQNYFVASRTERPDCLTKQAFTILKQFAESFAKLALRHEVLTIDAIGAIFLSEHFIQHLYGVGMDPPPMLESVGFVGYVDAFIGKFHDWLKSYINKYSKK